MGIAFGPNFPNVVRSSIRKIRPGTYGPDDSLQFIALKARLSQAASDVCSLQFYSLPRRLSAQSAQGEIRIFHFVNIQSDNSYNEMVTTIKQVARVTPELPVDPASPTLTISASPEQLAIVDWIVNELDAKKTESPELGGAPKLHQFTAADGNKVDIFYLDPAAKPRDIQEMITVLRQVVEVNRLFNYTARKAIVLQAPPNQAGVSEWLIPQLAKQEQGSDGDEHKMPGAPDDVVRIFHWNSSLTPTQVQELTHQIRRDVQVSRLFTVFDTRALAVRGTSAQLTKVSEIVSGPPPSR